MISTKNPNSSLSSFLNKYMLQIFLTMLVFNLFSELDEPNPTTTIQYILIFTFLPILMILRERHFSITRHPALVGILCCLVYGILVGFLKGNEPLFVLRNGFGFVSYIVFFIILSGFSKEEIVRLLFRGSILANFLLLFMAFTHSSLTIDQFGYVRFIYSPLIYFCFISFIYNLDRIYTGLGKVSMGQNIFFGFNLLIIFFNSIVLSLSKGAILGLMMILLIYCVLILAESTKRAVHFFLLLLPALIFILLKMNLLDLMSTLAPSAIGENVDPRFLQNEYLWNEATMLGSGLGSYLQNGFLRDPLLKYAYEATFFNYINKLGIVSLILWSIYGYTLFLVVKAFFDPKTRKRALIGLSSTIFFFMGLGNPTLFSPSSVFIHVSILVLLYDKPSLKLIEGARAE